MNTYTKIEANNDQESEFYTIAVTMRDEDAMLSLTDYIENNQYETDALRCPWEDEGIFGDAFSASKDSYDTKKEFITDFRKAVKAWKKSIK